MPNVQQRDRRGALRRGRFDETGQRAVRQDVFSEIALEHWLADFEVDFCHLHSIWFVADREQCVGCLASQREETRR